MGFFSKKPNENNGFIINTNDETESKITGDQKLAPHAMTPDEITNLWVLGDDNTYRQQTSALDSLKMRMQASVQPQTNQDSTQVSVKEQTTETKLTNTNATETNQGGTSANDTKTIDFERPVEPVDNKITLIEKVKRYTVDEHGQDMSESREPLYKLETVAEIIMSDGQTAMKNLSEKYGVDICLGGTINPDDKPSKPKAQTNNDKTSSQAIKPTPTFEQMVTDSEKRETQKRLDSLFSEKNEESKKEENDNPNYTVPDISDIDTHETDRPIKSDVSSTATIRFTPVKDNMGNTDHITISNATKQIDLGDDFYEDISSQNATQNLENSDFEKFIPSAEINDIASGKKLLRRLALQKRSSFFVSFVSALCVIALSIFLIPPVYDFIIANPKNAMFTCGAFLLASIIANAKMFIDFKNLFNKRCGFDAFAALCSISSVALTVSAALTHSNAYYIILLCSIILFVRSICAFKEKSYLLSNLKQILNDKPKNAVTLINDPATTFAMAKNKIDGDILAAAHKNTVFVSDYMKHNEFAPKLSGKGPFMFYFTLTFAIICAIVAYFYYQNVFDIFYSATVVTCMSALPTLFFIDALPLSAAAKKLNARGAMIAGMYGAERIELTNAAVVHINDIFPIGTVKMYSMRVLSKNNIDDTIMRAASLTAAVKSPLEAIFNQIAGTNTSYTIPDSDTVKYEKNLGISGWVNNELLFIGNRSFMQAHGIQIPSLEIDKKILRKGYFPVYVATTDTACALIVIQYTTNAEVTKQLRKITDMGVTLLVENSDPNITEEMLCDYFGLYEDSVKIMSNAGVYMLKNATPDSTECSAPAAYRGSNLNLVRIINSASMIKRSSNLLTIMYVLFAVLGIMYFVYAAFSGLLSMPQPATILLYGLGTTFLSIIGFLIRKP